MRITSFDHWRGAGALLLTMALLAGTAGTAWAELEIGFGMRFQNRTIGTQANTITQYSYPMNFVVRILNTGTNLERAWIGPQGELAGLEFIFTDSTGKRYHVKKKPIKVRSSTYVSTNIAPEKEVWGRILLTDDEWDNLPPMAPGVTTVYHTQVIYNTPKQTLKSEMYQVYVGVGPLPAVQEEPTLTTQETPRVVTPPGQTGVFIVPKPTEQTSVDPNKPLIIQ